MTTDAQDDASSSKGKKPSVSKVSSLIIQPGKHTDGTVPGLYLEVGKVRKDGKPSKNWRLEYRLHGEENRFSILGIAMHQQAQGPRQTLGYVSAQ